MNKRKERLQYLLSLTVSVLLALVLGGVLMAATGHDPLEGYGALITGAFGSPRGIGNTLAKSATLCLTGLATAVAAQAGIFNVGGEGQLYLGAIASAYVGSRLAGVPAWIGVPLCLLAAMLAGGLYAWIPAVLKVKLKVNEVITTIMMNSAAIYFCSYLANGPLKTTDKGISARHGCCRSLLHVRTAHQAVQSDGEHSLCGGDRAAGLVCDDQDHGGL